MKKLNLPLLAGGIILLLLIVIILFPEKFTSFNPYVIEGIKTAVQKNGSLSIQGAPFPPSNVNILGTDQLGRDEFSLLIYGTRLTMELGILVVIGRFIIAVPVGIAAGFGNSLCRSIISLFSVLFSAIPALLISIIVLSNNFFSGLFKEESIIAFVIVLTLVGFGKLAFLIRERVENILSQQFITGEKAIGKSNFKIAVGNVLPHLSAELIVLFFMEMSLALSMIMELGFFGVYVGNLRVVSDSTSTALQFMKISYEPEWASMLASSISNLGNASWTVLSPAVTFFISILGFNLFGEGLREELQNKNSKFAMRLKISIKKAAKAIPYVLTAVLIAVFAGGIINYYNKRITAKETISSVNWQFKDQVLLGSKEAEYTADNLKKSLREAGFQPIKKDFIDKYNIPELYSAEKSSFTIENNNLKKELIFGKDFSLSSYENFNLKGEIYNANDASTFNINNYKEFNNKFVVFDEQIYPREIINKFTDIINKNSKALGVIDIIDKDEPLPDVISDKSSGKKLIYVTRNVYEYLKNDSKLTVNIESCSLSGEGRNVIGILPGKNPKLSKEAIIIGVGYNYLESDRNNAIKRIKITVEIAKRLHDIGYKQGRSIIIAFWDGNLIDKYCGVRNYISNLENPIENTVVNIDLTNIDAQGNTVMLNTEQVPVTKYFAWAFNHEFEQNLKHSGIQVIKNTSKKTSAEIIDEGPDAQEIFYYKGTVPTILALPVSGGIDNGKGSVENNFVNVLLNSITNINY